MGEEYTYSEVLDANHYKAERDAALEKIKRIQEAIDESIEDNQNALLLMERDELREKLERAEKKVANLHERLVKHTACEKRLGKYIEHLNDVLRCRKLVISELSARAMPEGYRWPKVDGKPVRIGERLIGYGSGPDGYEVVGVRPSCGWVLVKPHKDCILEWDASECKRYHVIAADGEPIEVGQTVYFTCDGYEVEVAEIDYSPGTICNVMVRKEHTTGAWCEADKLTHQRPALDADGVPINVGDTVWNTNGGGPFEVEKINGDDVEFTANYLDGPLHCGFKARELTHNDPNKPDSWERVEDDATLEASTYCDRKGIKVGRGESFVEPMARDLVNRCKALEVKEGDHGRR